MSMCFVFFIYIYIQDDYFVDFFLVELHYGMVHVHVTIIQQVRIARHHSVLLLVSFQQPVQTTAHVFTTHRHKQVHVHVLPTLGQVCINFNFAPIIDSYLFFLGNYCQTRKFIYRIFMRIIHMCIFF